MVLTLPHRESDVEQQETFIDRVEREFTAFVALLRRRWLLAIAVAVGLSVYVLWKLGAFSAAKPAKDTSAAAAILQVAQTYEEIFRENQRLHAELDDAKASAQQADVARLQAEVNQIGSRLQDVNRDLNKKTERLDADPKAYGGVVVPQAIKTVGPCHPEITGVAGDVVVKINCPELDPLAVEELRKQLAALERK